MSPERNIIEQPVLDIGDVRTVDLQWLVSNFCSECLFEDECPVREDLDLFIQGDFPFWDNSLIMFSFGTEDDRYKARDETHVVCLGHEHPQLNLDGTLSTWNFRYTEILGRSLGKVTWSSFY